MIGPLLLLVLGAALAASAGAVGVAAAAVSQLELTRWVAYRLRGAGAAAGLLQNPGAVLTTANALTTIGMMVSAMALPALLAATTPTTLGILTLFPGVPVFVTLAYLVPRAVGRRWAEPIVARALPWMQRVGRALEPFLPRREPSKRTALAAVLSGSATEALATTDEIAVVSGVLAFADRPVRELMTPRTQIVALPDSMLAAEAAHVFAQSGFSRYLVYGGSLDEVRGVAHLFDLLALEPTDPVPVHPAPVVPATTRTADLMLEIQRGKGHLAIVLDEFGGTAGIVSFDDLLASLVHEVFGEPARPTEPEAAPHVVEYEGNAPLATLATTFGGAVAGREAETVGGLLVQALGRIPRPGERFQLHGLEFDVLAASTTRVERVAVRRGPVRVVTLDGAEAGP